MATPSAAKRAASVTLGEMATRAHLEVLNAGREVIRASSPRWRRVTDGNPCGFCAMLASRGPVYGSAEKAGSGGNRYHARCGCTAEPFEGDFDEWEPTPDEQRFIDAYDAVHEPGMSAEETAARVDAWLKDPANALAEKAAELTVDGLDEDAFDALVMRYMDEGDFDSVDRLSELWDAKQAASQPIPWSPDAADPFNPTTFEWFESLDVDAQIDFLDQVPYAARDAFTEQQWAWANAKSAPKRGALPPERVIRAEWDAYIESEWLKLEEATNGHALTRQAQADGRRIRDLWRVNERTARSWASEETRRYWETHGRLTYDAFKAGYTGGTESLQAGKAGRFWV